MRVIFLLLTGFFIFEKSYAHNMRDELKKNKIKQALASLTNEIRDYEIEISPNPFSLNLDFQGLRFDPGDKDIDFVTIETKIDGEDYKITCDLLSAEYGREKPIYFMIYDNCKKTNIYKDETKSFNLATQEWPDWKY